MQIIKQNFIKALLGIAVLLDYSRRGLFGFIVNPPSHEYP